MPTRSTTVFRHFRIPLALAILSLLSAGHAFAQLAPGSALFLAPGVNLELDADALTRFGDVLVVGDFDGNDIDDLAIGMPGAWIDGNQGAGAVLVLYGSSTGISLVNAQLWHQSNLIGAAEAGADFGQSLAAADFDGDEIDDLAIGAPDSTVDGVDRTGAVHVLLGSNGGLITAGSWFLHRQTPAPVATRRKAFRGANLTGTAQPNDAFGHSLAAGDFNQDQLADLAIGVPFDDNNANGANDPNAGSIQVIYSTFGLGPSPIGDDLLNANSGILDEAEANDEFAFSLVAGSFRGQDGDDLAIGTPGYTVDGLDRVGAIFVFPSSDAGLDFTNAQIWHTGVPDVLGTPTATDRLGRSQMATADFDGDGADDLAIGVSTRVVSGVGTTGAVHVLYGTPDPTSSGLTAAGNQLFLQEDTGIAVSETNDSFGLALAAGDLDLDGFADLAIGVPGESGVAPIRGIPADAAQGMVMVLAGGAGGIVPTSAVTLTQTLDPIEQSDAFGRALALGRFDGQGLDLAVGAPGESIAGMSSVGAVSIKPNRIIFGDGFESSDTAGWSATNP